MERMMSTHSNSNDALEPKRAYVSEFEPAANPARGLVGEAPGAGIAPQRPLQEESWR